MRLLDSRVRRQRTDATPLDPAPCGDLLQTWITSRADLNEAEEENIVKGAAGGRRRGKAADLLTEDFVKTLHKQMFGEVWKWTGTYRQGELNIGIAPHLIADDARSRTLLGRAQHVSA
jgi:fido (protein-threonine AMPylation protein)